MIHYEALAEYIRSLAGFEFARSIDGNYGHMGALITDAVLQAGMNYATVVRPRVTRLVARYPQARTTSAFLQLLNERGPEDVLQWSGQKKLATMHALIQLFLTEQLETEDDLRKWLSIEENRSRLRQIKGIKEKTADYIRILLGESGVAIDRHLIRFLEDAGHPVAGYQDAHDAISAAAKLLDVDASLLDHSIWQFMSQRVNRDRAKGVRATTRRVESAESYHLVYVTNAELEMLTQYRLQHGSSVHVVATAPNLQGSNSGERPPL